VIAIDKEERVWVPNLSPNPQGLLEAVSHMAVNVVKASHKPASLEAWMLNVGSPVREISGVDINLDPKVLARFVEDPSGVSDICAPLKQHGRSKSADRP
jgi:hypothetical protein